MSFTRSCASLVLLLSLGHSIASAQDAPRFEVAGGYSLLRDQDLSTRLHGWFASVGGSSGGGFGLVGEVGGNYKTVSVLNTQIKARIYSVLAGPKYTVSPTSRVSLFGQFLVGAARASTKASGSDSASETDFAFQPGGGVDIVLTGAVGVRVGGDFRGVRSNGHTSNEGRFIAGLVFRKNR